MDGSEKIKYHIQLLAEALDARESPIASLVILNDWSASDLDSAHDIFEQFDQKLEQKEVVNWYSFEREFQERFGLSYQGLKSVVLAFFRNDQWVAVCKAYASEHQCVEFSEVVSRNRADLGGLLMERTAAILARNNIPYEREAVTKAADGKTIRLDFILALPTAKIAVEVKGSLNLGALEHMAHLASEVTSEKVVDEFWVVVESVASIGRFEETVGKRLSVMTLDGLEQKLSKIS